MKNKIATFCSLSNVAAVFAVTIVADGWSVELGPIL
jgi:hypothetical protein